MAKVMAKVCGGGSACGGVSFGWDRDAIRKAAMCATATTPTSRTRPARRGDRRGTAAMLASQHPRNPAVNLGAAGRFRNAG